MKYFYVLIIIVAFFSCKTQKQINETGYTAIHFGSGGGVTNNVTSYSLYSDGKVWKNNSINKDLTLIKKFPKSKVLELYMMVKDNGLDTVRFSRPGNMYYFVDIVKGDKNNKITWGRKDTAPPVEVLKLYDNLIKSIK
jgi:hypothetical protein